jgi:hypothetical protein
VQAEQAAEKVDSERVLVAQEWLCYWTFSATCEACLLRAGLRYLSGHSETI